MLYLKPVLISILGIVWEIFLMCKFLDIQAAFDTIQPLAIKQALYNLNMDDKLVDWYYNFLTHRHLITEHN